MARAPKKSSPAKAPRRSGEVGKRSLAEELDLYLDSLPPELRALPRPYRLWVLYYCGESRWDASDAARRAGLGGNREAGWRVAGMLAERRPDVKAARQAWLAQGALGAAEWTAQVQREALTLTDDRARLAALRLLGERMGLIGRGQKAEEGKALFVAPLPDLIRHFLGREHDLDEQRLGERVEAGGDDGGDGPQG